MAQVQCQIEIPKEASPELTVGQIFFLNCEGEWPAELKKEALELRLEQADQYKLKLLDFEFTSKTNAKLTVTSYKVGSHQLKAVQVVDPENSVVLGDLQFAVASVQDPQKPAEKPFGPFGPFSLHLSIWYPLTLLLILLGLGSFFFYRWKLRNEKKRLLAEMRLDENAQDPYFQFYHTVRKEQRSFAFFSGAPVQPGEMEKFISEIDVAFRVYLARKFLVPTLHWSERKILSDLKRNHKVFYAEFRLEIRKVLAELARARATLKAGEKGGLKDSMTGKDAQQLLDLLRKQADAIETWTKGKRK